MPLFSGITKYKLAAGIVFMLFLSAVDIGIAQERDTTEIEIFPHPKDSPSFRIRGHHERSVNNLPLPSSGIYGVPEKKQYYHYQLPFKGQDYLDLAVKAYREEQKRNLGLGWLFRFINAIAPYVNNRFEFGVYQIEDLPVIERGHPLLYPPTDREKEQ